MSEEAREKIILPDRYYLTYFNDLLDFVERISDHLLGEEERSFIDSFRGLSMDGQCLFLRFSNRKGPYFRLDKISYEEFDVQKGTDELIEKKFITTDVPQTFKVLGLFLKGELLKLFKDQISHPGISKVELQEEILQLRFLPELQKHFQIVEVLKQQELEFVKMLYFGHYHGMMTEFVVRDVGHVTLENLDESQFKPWFQTRDEAMALFHISKLSYLTNRSMTSVTAETLVPLLKQIDFTQFQQFPKSGKRCDKLLLGLARQLEREGEPDAALFFYQFTEKHPSRERQIRLLDQLNRKSEAQEKAYSILENYENAEELLFARDYLARPKIRINRSTTAKESLATTLEIKPQKDITVERLTLQHFENEGFNGIHGENLFWRNLFGLFFWEELYDQGLGDFHHPLQRASADLRDQSFYKKRYKLIKEKVKAYDSPELLIQKVNSRFVEKMGVANPFVYWFEDFPKIIEEVIPLMDTRAVLEILEEMSKNLKDNVRGFPDILIWNKHEYHFYEIKSPNDHLSAQQLFWIEFMNSCGIQAEILRLKYI